MSNSDLKNAIMQRLATMEPEIPVYADEITGMLKPCFLVSITSSAQTREMNRRYRRNYTFAVQFYPADDSLQKKTDCEAMAERLYEELEYVDIDGRMFRANELKNEIADNTLRFSMNIDVVLSKDYDAAAKMQRLEQEETIRNG